MVLKSPDRLSVAVEVMAYVIGIEGKDPSK